PIAMIQTGDATPSTSPRVGLSLQLALQFIKKAPVGVLGDDLLRRRFDGADFTQAKRVKTQRVLRIVFAPPIVRDIAEGLQSIVVPRREAAIDEPPRDQL